MFKGKYLDIYLTCEKGKKAVHMVLNIRESKFNPAAFSTWVADIGLKKNIMRNTESMAAMTF